MKKFLVVLLLLVSSGCAHSDAPIGTTPLKNDTSPALPTSEFETKLSEADALGDNAEALVLLHELAQQSLSRSQTEALRAKVDDIVWHKLSDSSVETLLSQLPNDSMVWSTIAHRKLGQTLATDDLQGATKIGARIRSSGRPSEGELATLLERLDELTGANPQAVGVLLPLSGRGRDVGKQILQGIQVAARFSPQSTHSVELIVNDTEGQNLSDIIAAMVQQQRVIAIIGPASRRSAQQAADIADSYGVPILTFTTDEKITSDHQSAFRFFMSFEEEIDALVQAASKRTSRIAILYPDHAFGRLLRTSLHTAVAKLGTTPCFEQAYEPGTSSFVEAVRTLKDVDCGALIMAGRPTSNAILAATLASEAFDKDFQLLVPSTGWSDTLISTSSRYVQDALVTRPYVHNDASDLHQRFVDAYRSEFGQTPNAFAAYGFDAFRLVASRLSNGDDSRKSLHKGLMGTTASDPLLSFGGLSPQKTPASIRAIYRVKGKALHRLP